MAKRATIVKTQGAVAKHFGRCERTVREWIARGMPGRVGRYNLDRIAAWAHAEGLLGGPAAANRQDPESAKARLDRLRGDAVQLKLARQRGELVAADPVRRLVGRLIHEAKSRLDQLPDRILAGLPAELTNDELARIRRHLQKALDDTYTTLAEIPDAPEIRGLLDAET